MASVLAAIPTINSASVPGKVIIRGTSRLTLKDRFSSLHTEAHENQPIIKYNHGGASVANRRLAQEMGNRPEVVAALHFKRKPVMQRLGVRARLGIPTGMRQRVLRQRNGFAPMRGWNNNTGRFAQFNNTGVYRPRFGPKRLEGGWARSPMGFGFAGNGFAARRFRPGNWRMNRGGARGGPQKQRLSREELDRQLDEYMAKTRGRLDDDLDAYMGEATI